MITRLKINIPCPGCGKMEVPHFALGLCRKCYFKARYKTHKTDWNKQKLSPHSQETQ